PTSNIKSVMEQMYEEEQKWLSNDWVGRALRRLGFTEKRRLGTHVEWKIDPKYVETLYKKYVGEIPKLEEKTEGEKE
ncbi:MAG: hypothetical protein ACPLZG_13390, partial [Thermoproteota archaeon]